MWFLLDFASHVSPQNQHNSWPKVVKNGLSPKPQLLLAYITYSRSSSCDYNVYCKYQYQSRIPCVYQICNSISTYDSTYIYVYLCLTFILHTTLQVSSPQKTRPIRPVQKTPSLWKWTHGWQPVVYSSRRQPGRLASKNFIICKCSCITSKNASCRWIFFRSGRFPGAV